MVSRSKVAWKDAMLQPDYISVGELASRWNQTERQILEHGLHSRMPIIFLFRGMLFDPGDKWNRESGADYQEAKTKADRLEKSIELSKAQLARNRDIRVGRVKASKWEDPLSDEDVKRIAGDIERDSTILKAIQTALDLRDTDRREKAFYGYLQAYPGTLGTILEGKRPYVPIAIHQGRMVSIEGKKMHLDKDDLLIPMQSVLALETPTVHDACSPGASPAQKLVKQPSWSVKKFKRSDGLRHFIRKVLLGALEEGREHPPNARELATILCDKEPSLFTEVADEGLTHCADGDARTINYASLQDRIDRLVVENRSVINSR